MVLESVDDHFGVRCDPSWPCVSVLWDVDATIAAVESIYEGGVGSGVVESRCEEDDALRSTEMFGVWLADDHHCDSDGEVIVAIEA